MQGTTTATTGMDEDNQSRFPESYYCPLTHEVMEDPVVDPEGNSYERSAIEDWLKKNSTSPITRTKLTLTELVPNRALKDAIDQRRRELGMPVAQSISSKNSKKDKEVASGDSHEDGEDDGTGVTISAVARKKQDANDEHEVLVSVRTPAGTLRTPADVCCVIDVSGSMGTEATLKTAGGGVEAHGLSLLDIVKHAVKTIICALLPQDRLALVVYSDAARTVLDLTAMDDKAKERATAEVERLGLEGSTNIWDGLNAGLELLRKKSESSNRLSTLLLLTDGLPTTSPPRGEAAMLKRYKEQNPQLSCTVSTFGFGYSINSELLNDVAIEGGGSFAFIPDSSFVGTSFIHAVSNLLSTMAKSATLSLEPLNGATLIGDGVPGGYACQKTSWGASINLYSLQYGQTKDIVVRMSIPSGSTGPYLSATLKYLPTDSATAIDRAVDATARDNSNDEVVVQRCRLFFVDQVRQAMDLMKKNNATGANQVIDALVDELVRAAVATQDDRLKGLLEDAQGQVKEAFSRADWYKKWGSHYLPSLFRAHLLQQCNNFKDPGVQHYGGQLFRKLRDEVDDIFVKLPPPKPSIKKTTSSSGATRSAPVRSMAVYHCSGNPCFAGECLVRLANGKQIPVHQIRKGCSVATADASKPADVLCVVKTACHQGKTQLVELDGGLLVTPYHPVRVHGKWHFPRDLGEIEERPCPAVYSFVLKQEHTMIINGVQCVTLGHEFDEDEVVAHPYFGSRRVVEDLQQMRGWEEGLVELAPGCLARDPVTGLVCGFQQN